MMKTISSHHRLTTFTCLVLLTLGGTAVSAQAPRFAKGVPLSPDFSKVFAPDTIGPGSTSTLVFTIDNSGGVEPLDQMVFTDTLPSDMTLAAPAFVSNTCSGTVTAPDGGDTISLDEGLLGAGQICEIVVNVTAVAVDGADTTYTNTSGVLTWGTGENGSATDVLTVDVDRPGFSKSFAPSTVEFGGRSTLTFTIDNSLNDSPVAALDFVDNLPPGMVVADPANASTICGTTAVPATLTAVPGTSAIVLDANGTVAFPAVAAGAICTVSVDVIGGAVGSLGNVSGNLLASFVEAGKAAAVLEVNGVEDLLELRKEFTDDPVAPGGTVTLEFTVLNKSRDDSATGITFSDTIDPMGSLTGVTATVPGTPDPPCGAGSSLDFTSGALTLTGGTLPPAGSCTFSVELSVPGTAANGSHLNTAGPVSGDVGGSPETGNTAGDLLFVSSFPLLTKTFTDDPVGAGGTVTLEFMITNPEATSTMSGITFVDELTDNSGFLGGVGVGNGFLPFPVSVGLPPTPDPPCGAGSSLAIVGLGTDRQGLELTGGTLPPAGSCTFSVTIDIPTDLAAGTYTNTTEPPTAVLGGLQVLGKSASDDIVVVAAPSLAKEFTDDPVPPGGTVTLEFTLTHDALATADATGIGFIDDLTTLAPAVSGLTATSVTGNTCSGSTVDISTPTLIDFSGGTLAPGASCTVSVSLSVPGDAPSGFHTNTTSEITATVDGVAVTGNAAEDDLLVTGLLFSKAFTGDPVIAGGTATLSFTLDNTTGATDATGISFSDNLAASLPGLTATLPPTPAPPCGVGSSLIGSAGDTLLTFSGGSVAAGTSCTFSVTVTVPATIPNPPGPPIPTPDDTYLNVTGNLFATIGVSPALLPPASDGLTVQSGLLALTKEFTDDPVNPGDTVTLELTLTNLSATETVTDIAFDDDLDAALSGLVATGATTNTCGGMSAGFPTGLFEYSGGTLGPGASCTIVLSVAVPAGPLAGSVFPNTTTGVTGKVGALDVFGDPASDDLEVRLLNLTKSFDGPTTAGGTAILTFTLTNLDALNPAAELAFSDDLGAVIPGLVATPPPTPNPPCGAGSALAGTSFLAFTGGSLAPAGSTGDSCSFAVTVAVPAAATAGSFLNTTSGLLQSGLPAGAPATAFLEIEPPPTFAKSFAPDTIIEDATSTLTFTIDNSASALPANSLDFTDNLPAGVVIASPPSASTTCTGGTVTAVAGTDVVTYAGGSVAAGASCTVSVDVTSTTQGIYVNVTGDLTSSSGNSGTASATLTVGDGTGPVVTGVSTVAGPLASCDTVRLPIANLQVRIEDDSSGIVNADSPSSYLLVGAGPDGDFSTAACGGAAGDDIPIEIVSLSLVSIDPILVDVGIRLSRSNGLAAGLYRFIVCDTITDSAGNALDGNGDMVPGGDFVLPYFRADPRNLFENGHFDACPVTLDPWVTIATPPNTILPGVPGTDDSEASPLSAAARFSHSSAEASALAQCVPVDGGFAYDLAARVRFDPLTGAAAAFAETCELFAGAACTGTSLGSTSIFSLLEDEGGAWISVASGVTVPEGATSALCDFAIEAVGSTSPDFDAFLDGLFFGIVDMIFADGFESGDTSAWSSSVP